MPDPTFVTAVNRNGTKQRVPRAWLAPGHRFASQFKLPPSARVVEDKKPAKRSASKRAATKRSAPTNTPPGGDKE